MKTVLIASALALAATLPAAARMTWDPAEAERMFVPDAGNPANVEAAARERDHYTTPMRIWDPVEGEFATVMVAPNAPPSSAIATHGRQPTGYRMRWDPAEAEMVREPVW